MALEKIIQGNLLWTKGHWYQLNGEKCQDGTYNKL